MSPILGRDDSSPEESTLKQTWSGSVSPGFFSSGSDFSSSEEEEENISGKREIIRGKKRERNNKRNSMTKDCNSDFHWVISEKQNEEKAFCGFELTPEQKSKLRKYESIYDYKRKDLESIILHTLVSGQRSAEQSGVDVMKMDSSVQLRLPPQSPGSLDRKRLPKGRTERDKKSKSSIITRSPQMSRKSHNTKSLGEEINLSLSDVRKHDYYYGRDDWQQCFNEDSADKYCQHFRGNCSGHGCCGDRCHHHYTPPCQSQCRAYYGSCESLPEKAFRKNIYGSQRTLCEERSPRKSSWQENQQRLMHGSNECLSGHCCQVEREKSYQWRILGKVRVLNFDFL